MHDGLCGDVQPRDFIFTLIRTVLVSPSRSFFTWRFPNSYDEVTPHTHTVMARVGQNHTYIRIYGVYTVLLAGKSPYIRSYTVCIYGSVQP